MNTELTRYQSSLKKYQPTTLPELVKLSELFAASGLFNVDNVRQSAAQLAVKILAGQELGVTPFAAANGMHIIKGKCAPGANLMAAKIKATGRYDYRVVEMNDTKVSIEFFENGKSIGVSTFTAQDAARAGTQNMGKYPRNMLFARAMSNGAKWFCPDAFNGVAVYTPEELGATVDDETGEIIEVAGNGDQSLVFSGPEDAISWGVDCGAFKDAADAETAYNTLKAERKPSTAAEMWKLWQEDVQERVKVAAENVN